MERLTVKFEGENVLRSMCTFDRESSTEPDDCISCKDVCEEFGEQHCEECHIQKAFDRLAEYEDADEKIRKVYDGYFGLVDLAEDYIEAVTLLNGGKEPRNIIYLSDEDADKWKSGLIAACHCGDCKYVDWRSMSTLRIRCAKTETYRDADDFCKYAERRRGKT